MIAYLQLEVAIILQAQYQGMTDQRWMTLATDDIFSLVPFY